MAKSGIGRYSVIIGIGVLLSAEMEVNAQTVVPKFEPVQPDVFSHNMALSNAWGDFDNDGDLDLSVSFKTGDIRLYRNDNGQFINIGPEMGLPQGGKETRSIAWGDFNEDGFLDLYVGSNQNGNELYRSNGAKSFTEVGVALGVDVPKVSTRQISWIDFDNDGTVDLFVADRVGKNHLFKNENGRFTDISEKTGLDDGRPTVGACWFDYNGDGLLDLFLANQSGTTDALYKNMGGTFVDVAPMLGMEGEKRTTDEGGVDCTVGDYDNDGDFDLFVANYGRNYLYENDGAGGFREVSESLGISGNDHLVGASWGDYDNDGNIDLYATGYTGPADNRKPVDRLFHNNGGAFTEIDISSSPLNGADHGIQWADFDRDGDLDISLTEGYNVKGRHPLLRNMLPNDDSHRSLQVEVLDSSGRPSRAGAEVRLYDMDGKLLATRLVSTGDGYNSHSNMPVHFGLGGVNKVTVDVTYLTADGRKSQTLKGISADEYRGGILKVMESN
ncbi:MAG: CRTAC1 family protein [Kordiimonadaceae bacterium]|nr:CRTAC1 family protein [Kordiimonadaceae bacterium]